MTLLILVILLYSRNIKMMRVITYHNVSLEWIMQILSIVPFIKKLKE